MNVMLKVLWLVLVLSTPIYAANSGLSPVPNTTEEALRESAKAAESWLHLIDQEKYDSSWGAGSQTFKLTVPQKNWVMLMNNVRKPMGKFSERKLLEQRTAKDPKGLPKGDYMVVFFDSSFEKKGKAHELVTLIQETDGQWRVLTYQIQ